MVSFPEALPVGTTGNYAVLRGSRVKMTCIPKESKGRPRAGIRAGLHMDGRRLQGDCGLPIHQIRERRTGGGERARERQRHLQVHRKSALSGSFAEAEEHLLAQVSGLDTPLSSIRTGKERDQPKSNSRLVVDGISDAYYLSLVYELSGHKFVTTVFIDMSDKSKDVMMTMLKDLVAARVCAQDLCTPGKVKVATCKMSETKKEICKYSIAYEAVPQLADELCDEECVRVKMFDGLKKSGTNIASGVCEDGRQSQSAGESGLANVRNAPPDNFHVFPDSTVSPTVWNATYATLAITRSITASIPVTNVTTTRQRRPWEQSPNRNALKRKYAAYIL
ncbi:ig-like domain-containing protein [Caerostris extrusa]|uniref:Ig-like domain-containing protein n=1 Tax=Caerostris extrusa TaxID=172846 RepID=A0AAV4XA00_CAEEX|nr:ig-like domain-containing protein [Caerostris extrusa]